MTAQDFRPSPAQVEISPEIVYPRARARDADESGPSGAAEPARARFVGEQGGRPAGRQPGEGGPACLGDRRRHQGGRFAPRYPLRPRAVQLRRKLAGELEQAEAATVRGELAVRFNAFRAAVAAADTGGMHDPVVDAAVRDVLAVLAAAEKSTTDAMHDWSPTP